MNSWKITLEEDPETKDLLLPFTSEMLEQFGWKVGDTLIWKELKNGSWSLRKKENGTSQDSPK